MVEYIRNRMHQKEKDRHKNRLCKRAFTLATNKFESILLNYFSTNCLVLFCFVCFLKLLLIPWLCQCVPDLFQRLLACI